jgi:hypothetical protein
MTKRRKVNRTKSRRRIEMDRSDRERDRLPLCVGDQCRQLAELICQLSGKCRVVATASAPTPGDR